jgi:hypothetical protein
MKTILESLNQWKVVRGQLTGSILAKQDVPTAEELEMEEAWELCKKRAYSEILLCVEDELRILIVVSQDPKDTWKNWIGCMVCGSQVIMQCCFWNSSECDMMEVV